MRTIRPVALAAALIAVLFTLVACGGGDDNSGDSTQAASSCTPKYDATTRNDGELTVAAIQYPPYSSVDPSSNDVGGIDGAIVKQFARDACLDLKVTTTTFAAAVSSVTSGRADIAVGDIYRTADRAKEAGLSDPVYLDQLGIVSKEGFDSIAALEGHKVATVQGYYFQDDVQSVYGDDLHLFPSNVNMYQDLTAGRSEAGLDSYPAAVDYLKRRGLDDFQVKVPPVDDRVAATGEQAAQSAFLYDKGASALGDAINEYLRTIRDDGTLGDLLEANDLPRSAADVGEPRLS